MELFSHPEVGFPSPSFPSFLCSIGQPSLASSPSLPGTRDVQMISCGADKSIYFRSAQQVKWGGLLGDLGQELVMGAL